MTVESTVCSFVSTSSTSCYLQLYQHSNSVWNVPKRHSYTRYSQLYLLSAINSSFVAFASDFPPSSTHESLSDLLFSSLVSVSNNDRIVFLLIIITYDLVVAFIVGDCHFSFFSSF